MQNLEQQNKQIQQENENQQNEETQQETELQENNDISDAEEELPRNIVYTQQETPTTNIQQDNNSQQTSEDAQTEDGHPTSEDEIQTAETYEKQQKIQIQIPQPKNMPLSAKNVFDWWTIPVTKYEMNPNRLYEWKNEGMYGAPLLKVCKRRMRAFLRKQAAQIRLSLNLNRDPNT